MWKGSDTDDEFGFHTINKLYEFHKIPLEQTGFTGPISELLEQWQSLCNYTIKYLSPETTEYHVAWCKIFQSSRKDSRNLILLLVELLFSLPVSNANVEKMFSLVKRIKYFKLVSYNLYGSARVQKLPCCSSYELWNDPHKSRRPNQAGKCIYKKCNKKKKLTTLMDESESDIDESKSETDEIQIDIDSDEWKLLTFICKFILSYVYFQFTCDLVPNTSLLH